MSFQVLNVSSITQFSNILSQIDARLLQNGSGTPVGVQGSTVAGIWYYDETNEDLYLCSATDGTGTPEGTSWIQLNFNIVSATTSTAGILALATQTEVDTGTNNTKAVTPETLATAYARNGVNSDITQLSGLTTPLSEDQGGTGANSLAALIAQFFPELVAGQYLSNNGSALEWVNPSTNVSIVNSNGNLAVNTLHVIAANTLSLILPTGGSNLIGQYLSIAFVAGLTTGPTIHSGDSDTDFIQGAAGPLVCDTMDDSFTLEWTGATYGWMVKQ